MRRRFSEEIAVNFILVVLLGYAVYEAFWFDPAARRLPLIVGIPTFILSLAVFVKELAAPAENDASGLRETSGVAHKVEPALQRNQEIRIIGWLIALLLLIVMFGLLWAVPIFLVLFLWRGAHQSWKTVVFLSAGAWAAVYLVFIWVFRLPLYVGILSSLWGS
jgi:Tripartite tricarboxylate transporter TctB family